MSDRAVVHILFTGGTISMRRDPVTGAALPALSGREIVARVPGLRREARLHLEDLARLPGPHVTPACLAEMGVILGGDLGGPKARIKLMVALGTTEDPATLRRIFEG